jgi:hypothetical protein
MWTIEIWNTDPYDGNKCEMVTMDKNEADTMELIGHWMYCIKRLKNRYIKVYFINED